MIPIIRFIILLVTGLLLTILIAKKLKKRQIIKPENKVIYVVAAVIIIQLAQIPIEKIVIIPIIRFIVLLVIGILLTLLIAKILIKKQIIKPENKVIYVVAAVIIIQIAQIPIENVVMKFQSPEKAFSYLNMGDYYGTEEGESSALVISKYKSEHELVYFDKENGYYKAPFIEPSCKILNDANNQVTCNVISEKGTENCYVVLIVLESDTAKERCVVSDSKSSVFQRHLYSGSSKQMNKFVSLYSTYVKNMDDSYFLELDGEKIEFVSNIHKSFFSE